MVTHTCCDGSSHQTGAVNHHGLCLSPSTFVSAARLQVMWSILLRDRCFLFQKWEREGSEKPFLSSHSGVLSQAMCWNKAETIQSSVDSCCAICPLTSLPYGLAGDRRVSNWYHLVP